MNLGNASCAIIAAGVVALTEAGDLYAAVGCMDELATADVNTNMGNTGCGVCIGEEHQITGLQAVVGDIGTVGVLGVGGTVDGVAALTEYILGKAGAVKAGRRSTAPDIGNA